MAKPGDPRRLRAPDRAGGPVGRGGRLLRHYSKGMLQRAGIARLCSRPELLILDESPSRGRTRWPRIQFRDMKLGLKEQERRFFLVARLTEAEQICDRVGS
jgi:ABC-2 type transport system ATP-binding protein